MRRDIFEEIESPAHYHEISVHVICASGTECKHQTNDNEILFYVLSAATNQQEFFIVYL